MLCSTGHDKISNMQMEKGCPPATRLSRGLALPAVLIACLLALTQAPRGAEGLSLRSITSEGPPARPATFTTPEELNKYLSALTEYYTVLSRPRYFTVISLLVLGV